jgi:two-component system, cell cycle sensor histidine kinase and response regulator CckA
MGSAPTQASERVVIVADDDPTVCLYMARTLSDAGLRVVQARDGEEAATYLKTLGPDVVGLVVSDISMPRLNGVQLATLIEERWPVIPVLLVSGEGGRSEYAGPYLPKPFTPETLLALVLELMPPPHDRPPAS